VAGQGEEAVAVAEKSFKLLGEALEVLGNQQMKTLYDEVSP
jgi:DnaJ-class molecular chaperone